MVVIGLTGGILSGKSTVSGMLQERGAVVIDADKVGHEVYLPHTDGWRGVVAAFGREILKENDEVDRKRLGEIVFGDPKALERLNYIMHPRMHDIMKGRLEELRRQGVEGVVLEAAILIEAGWTDLVDQVWVTLTPEERVMDRLKERGGLSEEEARSRIRSQMPIWEKARLADVVINTDCPIEETKAAVNRLWEGIQHSVI